MTLRAATALGVAGLALLVLGGRGCGVVTPAPIAASGYNVLVVEETADRGALPPEQLAALTSTTIREWIEKQPGTVLVVDKDADVSVLTEPWQQAFRRPHATLPWIVVSNGVTGYEGPLPGTVDELQALLERYRVRQ